MSTTAQIISASTDATNHTGLGWYQTGQDRLPTGPAHFKSERRKYKNAGYTLFTILNEYIDNVAKMAEHIDVTANVSLSGMIESITISDDYEPGFANINERESKNPFNFGHMRPGQDDDDELSEFGVGMKAAAVAAGNLFTVYTKVSGICHRVLCNFDEMELEPNVNESYNPKHKLIHMEEYRAVHPFPSGSTIMLNELHPRFHEITTQSQLQKEFSDAISDAYSNYIRNGLIIRVNGVVVEEERDWFADPTCQLFNINTKIVILEKANSPRVFIAVRTDKKMTYKQYDTNPKCETKTKNQKRLKQVDSTILDQLMAQGYRLSHQLKSSVVHAIEINSTITFYSEDFHGENHDEVEKPLNHVCGYKDLRKYGSFQFEPRTDGNCNYNCHKIELKSKALGKELGLTFRKQFTLDLPNDLTRMIREIIKDNNLKLSSNTSKNSDLCQRYLDDMNVDILTCNVEKLSSEHKKSRAALLVQAEAPVQAPQAPAPSEIQEYIVPALQSEAEIQAPPSLVSAPPSLVPDSVREVGPSVHQRITRAKGENIIDHWRNSGEHQATFDKTLDDMIKSYQDRCAPDQIQDMLTELNPSMKCNLLLVIIKRRYPLPEADMWKGIELLRTYCEAFGDAAVAGL